jgi:BA14K-like protein
MNGELFMNRSSKIVVAALMTAAMPLLVAPAGAAPLSSPMGLKDAASSSVETVQWRRGGWGRGGGWVGPAVAGAIIGGAIIGSQGYGYGPGYGYGGYGAYDGYAAAPGYAYGPGYGYRRGYVAGPAYGGGDEVAYCQQRFRSYDARSGTYLGYDGMRHPCP